MLEATRVCHIQLRTLFLLTSIEISSISVVKPRFMCPMHSEAKQTKRLEFGAEKCLLQGPNKSTGSSFSKDANSQGRVFKGKSGGRAAESVTFF